MNEQVFPLGFRRKLVWDSMTDGCREGDGEHRDCFPARPATVHTETMIVRDGGIDDGRFLRNYEVWHDAVAPVDAVLAGKLSTDPDTLLVIERLGELMRDLLRTSTLAAVGDEEALIALILAGYEHLIQDKNYRRASFDYR